MIQSILVSAALVWTAVAGSAATEMATRLGWVQEVRSLLPSVTVADRPAAFRNYAAALVDVGQCDTAKEVLEGDESFDAELVAIVMDHARHLGDARCAALLGKLVISRLQSSTSASSPRIAALRMAAGAAIQVGGDEATGASLIRDAEAALQPDGPASTLKSDQVGAQTLWAARADILDTYAGTPYHAPALTRFGRELATSLARSKTYLPLPKIRGWAMRFAASDRADLVDLIASKLWPADKQEFIQAATLVRHPEIAETLSNKPKPQCGESLGLHAAPPRSSEKQDAFARIVDLSIRSSRAATVARCVTLR